MSPNSIIQYKANLLEKSEAHGALVPGFGGKHLIDFSLFDTYYYSLWDTHRSELNGIPANGRTNRDIVRSARLEQTLALVEEAMILASQNPID